MRHAARHAEIRSLERRRRLAVEAARIMAEGGIRDFHQAKLKAAQRLGESDESALPRNEEIEEALREHQRLFQSESQPRFLRERREAAMRAMRFLAHFEPRLVGAVLEGTADAHSAVCLHLFDDDPTAVARFLAEHGVPYEERTRQVRHDRERSQEAPVLLFSAEGVSFDLTVLPRDALRQPPRERGGQRTMARASLASLEAMLLLDDGPAVDA